MNPRYIVGIIFIVLGISAFTGLNLGRFIGPLILILIGLAVLTGRQAGPSEGGNPVNFSQDTLNEVAVFSGTNRKIVSSDFRGGKIVTVFSGSEHDLSGVKTKEKVIEMELVAVFGGLRLKVPKDWVVVSAAAGVVGGIDNKAYAENKTTELRVKGAAVFGGIEIIN